MIVVVCLGILLLCWLARRRHRRTVLAGLKSDKPVFAVEPPHRRITDRKREAL